MNTSEIYIIYGFNVFVFAWLHLILEAGICHKQPWTIHTSDLQYVQNNIKNINCINICILKWSIVKTKNDWLIVMENTKSSLVPFKYTNGFVLVKISSRSTYVYFKNLDEVGGLSKRTKLGFWISLDTQH